MVAFNFINDENRQEAIYSLAKGNVEYALKLEKLSNERLMALLTNQVLSEVSPQYLLDDNIFSGNIKNSGFNSMDGLQVERCSSQEYYLQSQSLCSKNSLVKEDISDKELLKMWDKMPQYVKDLYKTYLDNLSEAERIEAEKGFLDHLRDFFVTGFKLMPYTSNPQVYTQTPEAWEQGVKNALTNSVEKKLKKDEKNIKELANLSINFEENISAIKTILKDILGIEVSEEEIRANKEKLLQIGELSKDFDNNISEITQIFKEMTGLDLLEEDLLNNKENIAKLNEKSEVLEKQYKEIKDKYKEITGKELSDEEFEKILNGETEIDNEEFNQLIEEYLQGYEEFAEITSDVVSAVVSFGAFCGGTVVGGPFAGFAAATATGAGVKYAMKKANASGKSDGYKTAAQDLVSGGVGGMFNAIAPHVGSTLTRAVFNRGGAKLLDKVILKSANKSLPKFLNKAVSLDNKYLGASATQHLAARYMQAAVEGTVAITPYNVASELMADDANKQGWDNVAINSVVGGLIFGPVMDLGFRLIGSKTGHLMDGNDRNIVKNAEDLIRTGSPVSAAAYKNITMVNNNTFDVDIAGKIVRVNVDDKFLPANPTIVYALACKQIGIESKEDILKTLGLNQINLSKNNPYALKNELSDLKQYFNVVTYATDGQQTYHVTINDNSTVTLVSVATGSNNIQSNKITMSLDDFVNTFEVNAYSRDYVPKYVDVNKLDRLANGNNYLARREVYDDKTVEYIVESIDKKNQTVVIKKVVADANGTISVEKQTMTYDKFINAHNPNRSIDEVMQKISDFASKYNYTKEQLVEYYFKGLDVNSPIFANEKSMLAYINDLQDLAKTTNHKNEPLFSAKRYNSSTNAIESIYDTELLKEIAKFKHENPFLHSQADKLIQALKKGELNTKGLRNIFQALETNNISPTTVDILLNKGSFQDGNLNIYAIFDTENPSLSIISERKYYLNDIKNIIGEDEFSKLQQELGKGIYQVDWSVTKGMKNIELKNFIDDVKKLYRAKQSQIEPENFFINIDGYGRNDNWAKSITQTANYASSMIKEGESLYDVLAMISKDTRQMDLARQNEIREQIAIAKKNGDYAKVKELQKKLDNFVASSSGVLRCNDPSLSKHGACTGYAHPSRYSVYESRFDYIKDHELYNPYPDMELTRIGVYQGRKNMLHPEGHYAKAALKHVDDIYKQIQQRFVGKEITDADLPVINEMVAEMHWILAHSMPWGRGSDAIANTFIKSVYNSLGIKTYPQAKGVSLDLQAFCTELVDYKKNYAKYYEKPPELAK